MAAFFLSVMPQIRLPDGTVRSYDQPVTAGDIAAAIGPGLAKAALAAVFNGRVVDLSLPLDSDGELRLITGRDTEALDLFRHDAAHVMAQAVQEMYPGTQVTIGPAIEDGFYYDFAREQAFTPEDLTAIEQRMTEIVARNLPIVREVWNRDVAIQTFRGMGEHYKVEIIQSIPAGEPLSIYRQGEWFDVCRGPHLPATGKLPLAFKLMKVAGAYWRGDARNAMLQRIYGTAWADKKALDAHLHRIEEAEKRDHRRIGKAQHLFHLQEEAPGMVFWHPKGWTLWQQIEQYLRRKLAAAGYQEIRTPLMMDRQLWERSGHWENYREHMFTTESEKRDYAVKPMNCPGHVQVFNQGVKSYRDLPLRLAEFGACHRNEPSGALHGLMRVRGFTQDDAHIFCTESQIVSEVAAFNTLLREVYHDFGFTDLAVKLALRPGKRAGSDEIWDRAEEGLRTALAGADMNFEELPGEGAFYGPKVEYHVKDAIGRSWQCGTVQLDFVLPERLDAEYVAEDNSRKRPVMLHRAIVGSMERFIGILIEHHAGALPLWLSPVQAVVANITDRQDEFTRRVQVRLAESGIRAAADLRNEKIGFKIREHSMQRVPYLLIVGDREAEGGSVAVRARSGKDLGVMPLETVVSKLLAEIASHGHVSLEGQSDSHHRAEREPH
jgi:threonyl-tRNA synthetase